MKRIDIFEKEVKWNPTKREGKISIVFQLEIEPYYEHENELTEIYEKEVGKLRFIRKRPYRYEYELSIEIKQDDSIEKMIDEARNELRKFFFFIDEKIEEKKAKDILSEKATELQEYLKSFED